MDFLDDLGKDDVQQKKHRGKKFVVDPDAADRYHGRGDRRSDPTHPEAVISSG